jgi:hypothetical protein
LNFDEAAQLQEKLLLGGVAFREDVVMVIEKIERLRELERKPWIHLDIAGTAWQDDAKPWNAKGATGVAVRTLVDLAMKFGSNGSGSK